MNPTAFKHSYDDYSSHFLNTYSPQAQPCSKLLKCINSFNLHIKQSVMRETYYVFRGEGIVCPELGA